MAYAIEYNYKELDWETREHIRFIYNYMCIECGRPDTEVKLDTHHIIPQRRGGRATLDNLIPLCRQCHWKFDGQADKHKLKQQRLKSGFRR